MKLNTGKCYLIVSRTKYEYLWVNIGEYNIRESKNMKLLDVNIDNESKFDEHISNLSLKKKQELKCPYEIIMICFLRKTT